MNPDELRARLLEHPDVAADPALAEVGVAAFGFVAALLDDDGNLTRTGNLTTDAREKLRTRITELLAAGEPS